MNGAYRADRILKILILAALVAILVIYWERQIQREQAFEYIHGRAQAGLALVRYVQLRRFYSEEVAYQRIAAFVKKHTPPDEHPTVDRLLASDRSALLTLAQNVLRQHPDEIDEI